MPPDVGPGGPPVGPPRCSECGAEMYEDRGRYDWVCPTRYHAADIENYSGEPGEPDDTTES